MPQRASYGGKKQQAKSKSQINKERKARKKKVDSQRNETVDRVYAELGLEAKGWSREDAELLIRSRALYELADIMQYDSDIETFFEEEDDLIDIAMNMAKDWKRKTHFTRRELEKFASMTEEQKERQGAKAREALEDYKNGITFGF